MTEAACTTCSFMSDSDIRVTPDFLQCDRGGVSGFQTGVSSCPYRAVPGSSLWSTLEAIGHEHRVFVGRYRSADAWRV